MSDALAQAAAALLDVALARGLTLSFAESCTGGLVAGTLTSIAGASEAFLGSAVTYAPSAKRALLGVPQDVIDGPGVVSSPCAKAMAEGSRRIFGSDVAVSVTGIAGPGGAERGKPVGTVWFGVATPEGAFARVEHFSGDRDEVRRAAVRKALELATRACEHAG